LYSTFAGGWPAIGLILMRLMAAIAIMSSVGSVLLGNPTVPEAIMAFLLAIAAILLGVGFCTPIVGTVLALIESGSILMRPAEWQLHLLVATVGYALAMLGPGLWSIDARLFGWKRIETLPRKS
jgi:putative oxidoreductase